MTDQLPPPPGSIQMPIEITWTPPFKQRDHDAHQRMLAQHKAVKQERVERRRKERLNPPRKYSGQLY
jgi:hypothetical protein